MEVLVENLPHILTVKGYVFDQLFDEIDKIVLLSEQAHSIADHVRQLCEFRFVCRYHGVNTALSGSFAWIRYAQRLHGEFEVGRFLELLKSKFFRGSLFGRHVLKGLLFLSFGSQALKDC